jgi:myo-inositol-hexaphosphate 3-phosphohydrolase
MMTSLDRRLLLTALFATTSLAQSLVPWTTQTPPVATFTAGDLAIVVDRGPAPRPPVVLGADPLTSGVNVYSLAGDLLQTTLPGATSGVDSRSNLNLPGVTTLAAVVSTSAAAITPVRVADAGLEPVFDPTTITSEGPLALTALADGGVEAWLGSRDLFARHLGFVADGGLAAGTGFSGFVEFEKVALPAAASAMIVDDRTGLLYVAMPSVGVSVVGDGGLTPLLIRSDFVADVAGLTLYPVADGGTLLMTSVPTFNLVAVHDVSIAGMPQLLGTFAVGPPDGGAQRVGGTQALDLTPYTLTGYPKGLLVVHDGLTANYKYVSLADLAATVVTSTGSPLPIGQPPAPRSDAGTDAGVDGGTDGGSSGGKGGLGGIIGDPPPTCGCSAEPASALLLAAWVVARRRRQA